MNVSILAPVRRFCAIAAVLLSSTWGATAAATPAAIDAIADKANTAMQWGDFVELERLYEDAKHSTERASDGRLPIELFRSGVRKNYDGSTNNTGAYYAQLHALTAQWVKEHPKSPLAHLLHARVLYARAWHFRGGGFASKVQPQAWTHFRQFIRQAEEHLQNHAPLLASDPTSYVFRIMIGRSADWSIDKQLEVAREGARRFPDDPGMYDEMLISLLPKWGGDVRSMDKWINEATELTSKTWGQGMYASLYQLAADEFEAALFTETRAQWPRIRQGFEDIMSRTPHPRHLNRFAYMACLAQDQQTTKALLDKIGSKPDLKQWGRSSSSDSTYETCKRWVNMGG